MTKIAEFCYNGTEIGVYLEPSRRGDAKNLHFRPLDGNPFPSAMNPRSLCNAIRRWRLNNKALLRKHGVTAL